MIPSELRSKIMRSVKSQNTGCEIIVRRLIWKLGFRFRLNVKSLPGSPDVVLKRHQKVIFVNGCFWHGHTCPKGRLPKSNIEFWKNKVDRNRQRDSRVRSELKKLGWKSLVIWQCELKKMDVLERKLIRFMDKT
ncbi:very short patch repair endonuclease [Dawidia soli]|uniref:Very short patch repair endonuclease n=1 Tax=Dawidia soli TaxID=2782352 RepID=A0AAP2DEW4_9BACT|nr:DNA mismatch endonuclease Vsr [Dawidia soli]